MALYQSVGAAETANKLALSPRSVYRRRRRLETKHDTVLLGPQSPVTKVVGHPQRLSLDIKDGTVLIGSDAHYWPGKASTAHRAFVRLCHTFDPSVVIMNGDAFDGAKLSRFPSTDWNHQPTVAEELGAVQKRLRELTDATPNASHIWTFGNHDQRFESRLTNKVPEFENIEGFSLTDHFPDWRPCFSVWINDDVVVKHRFKGGTHAGHNNTLNAGKSIVTGHLHSLKITPYSDYNGTRWGVDTGTLADPDGPQFTYAEDNPKNHRSGFVVLTFKDGKMLDPEMVRVWDTEHVCFRGELIKV